MRHGKLSKGMSSEVSLLRKEMRKRMEYRKAREQILLEMSTSLNSQISEFIPEKIVPKARILTPKTLIKAQ
jgi:hypothetical protein